MDDSPFHGYTYDRMVASGMIRTEQCGVETRRSYESRSTPLTNLERAWLSRPERPLHREVVLPRGRPTPLVDRWLFGLMCAVVVLTLAALPMAIIVHELAQHGWIDRVGS